MIYARSHFLNDSLLNNKMTLNKPAVTTVGLFPFSGEGMA